MTKVFFILGLTVFVFFIINVSAMVGVSSITGQTNIEIPETRPTADPISALLYIPQNIGIFFQLMTLSSTFSIFGTVLLFGYGVAMFWAILELVRGV